MLRKDCLNKTVYARKIVNGYHVGVRKYRVDSYLSTYKVIVTDIDAHFTTCMSIWDLYEKHSEAKPPKRPKTDDVAAKLIKHVEIFFNKTKGGLYGR